MASCGVSMSASWQFAPLHLRPAGPPDGGIIRRGALLCPQHKHKAGTSSRGHQPGSAHHHISEVCYACARVGPSSRCLSIRRSGRTRAVAGSPSLSLSVSVFKEGQPRLLCGMTAAIRRRHFAVDRGLWFTGAVAVRQRSTSPLVHQQSGGRASSSRPRSIRGFGVLRGL